jgi:hypothetical protein
MTQITNTITIGHIIRRRSGSIAGLNPGGGLRENPIEMNNINPTKQAEQQEPQQNDVLKFSSTSNLSDIFSPINYRNN